MRAVAEEILFEHTLCHRPDEAALTVAAGASNDRRAVRLTGLGPCALSGLIGNGANPTRVHGESSPATVPRPHRPTCQPAIEVQSSFSSNLNSRTPASRVGAADNSVDVALQQIALMGWQFVEVGCDGVKNLLNRLAIAVKHGRDRFKSLLSSRLSLTGDSIVAASLLGRCRRSRRRGRTDPSRRECRRRRRRGTAADYEEPHRQSGWAASVV